MSKLIDRHIDSLQYIYPRLSLRDFEEAAECIRKAELGKWGRFKEWLNEIPNCEQGELGPRERWVLMADGILVTIFGFAPLWFILILAFCAD